jgi:hypothetical protein
VDVDSGAVRLSGNVAIDVPEGMVMNDRLVISLSQWRRAFTVGPMAVDCLMDMVHAKPVELLIDGAVDEAPEGWLGKMIDRLVSWGAIDRVTVTNRSL